MTTISIGTRSAPVRNAWLSLLGFPFSFGAAFLIGEGLTSALGYPAGSGSWPPPAAVGVPVTILAVLVFGIPAYVAAWYARKGTAEGNRRGWIPAGIALGLLAVFLVLNTVPMGQ